MLSVVPAQCLGYTAKQLLAYNTGFSCYSTLRRWVYAKCRPRQKAYLWEILVLCKGKVSWDKLWKILQEYGIGGHFSRLLMIIQSFYCQPEVCAHVEGYQSKPFEILVFSKGGFCCFSFS